MTLPSVSAYGDHVLVSQNVSSSSMIGFLIAQLRQPAVKDIKSLLSILRYEAAKNDASHLVCQEASPIDNAFWEGRYV